MMMMYVCVIHMLPARRVVCIHRLTRRQPLCGDGWRQSVISAAFTVQSIVRPIHRRLARPRSRCWWAEVMWLLMQRAGLLQGDWCECVSCNDAVADAESRTTTSWSMWMCQL